MQGSCVESRFAGLSSQCSPVRLERSLWTSCCTAGTVGAAQVPARSKFVSPESSFEPVKIPGRTRPAAPRDLGLTRASHRCEASPDAKR